MNSKVLSLLLYNFPPGEQLKLRLVCKEWDRIIGSSKSLQNWMFTVDRCTEGLFCSLSATLKLKHFQFKNLEEEGCFLGDPELCRGFFIERCPRIETIYLLNCSLSIGRFFELISHCPRLMDLRIQRCPSIYQISLAALHWKFCYRSLRRNLAGLKTLKLAEIVISEKDLWGLTCEMALLEEVVIAANKVLPLHAIVKLMKGNCATLEKLTLIGRLFPENISTVELEQMEMELPKMSALKCLTLLRGHFKPTVKHSIALENLFKKCVELSELKITQSALKPETLSIVGCSLTKLELDNCSFAATNFSRSCLTRLQTLKIIQDADVNPTRTEAVIVQLLRVKMTQLETLQLELATGGTDCWKALVVPTRFSNLRSLSLSGFTDVERHVLERLFQKFPNLGVLELTNSWNLVDECLCSRKGEHGIKQCLGNLTNLRTLNLSRTMISNPTIDECLFMAKLECLHLDYTKVNRKGLEQIVMFLQSGLLPSLYYLDLAGSACQVSEKELNIMVESIAPRVVHINCAID